MTDKIKFEPKTLEEAKEYIADMFMSEELGTYGDRDWNGADSYNCISCYASKDIMGHCGSKSSHNSVDHDPSCKQDALFRWAFDQDE